MSNSRVESHSRAELRNKIISAATLLEILLSGLVLIGLFAVTTIFAFITLPVEFDASARALKWLDRSHLMNYFDHGKAKSALFWAAMTYVVGALSSLAMLLYYVFIFMNARGRN